MKKNQNTDFTFLKKLVLRGFFELDLFNKELRQSISLFNMVVESKNCGHLITHGIEECQIN